MLSFPTKQIASDIKLGWLHPDPLLEFVTIVKTGHTCSLHTITTTTVLPSLKTEIYGYMLHLKMASFSSLYTIPMPEVLANKNFMQEMKL